MRSDLVSALPLTLDSHQSMPIPTQLTTQIRQLIAEQVLSPGDHIPSTRVLAKQLGVSRGGVAAAYDQLAAEGYFVTAHGSGTTINPSLHQLKPQELEAPETQLSNTPQNPYHLNLDPGVPDTSTLINSAWRASWRQASSHPQRNCHLRALKICAWKSLSISAACVD